MDTPVINIRDLEHHVHPGGSGTSPNLGTRPHRRSLSWGKQYRDKTVIMDSKQFKPLMKNRLLAFGGLIASIVGLLVIFDALGVSDLRRCHTAAESYRLNQELLIPLLC